MEALIHKARDCMRHTIRRLKKQKQMQKHNEQPNKFAFFRLIWGEARDGFENALLQ